MVKLFDRLDFAIDDNGNLSLANGDIARASSLESMQKTIEWRLRTHPREWSIANPFIVAGIGDFMGRKNNEETADAIKQRIEAALGSDLFVDPRNLTVDIVPISSEEINIYIGVRNFYAFDITNTSDVEFAYKFSFNEGEILSLTGGTR